MSTNNKKLDVSQTSTQTDAVKIAKATQKPGQTKEQTKLISQGIEKGIAEYKKQQKAKAREHDKQRKKKLKQKNAEEKETIIENESYSITQYKITLIISWLLFISYLIFQNL